MCKNGIYGHFFQRLIRFFLWYFLRYMNYALIFITCKIPHLEKVSFNNSYERDYDKQKKKKI
ncbi:hypothetical protein C1646_732528 [Rhizophagus diaphanus]|nr:hypothetical protein C1646_732528 [Rhizophagus diaphanus] [Rhizophagus sp. MUCL 43196]